MFLENDTFGMIIFIVNIVWQSSQKIQFYLFSSRRQSETRIIVGQESLVIVLVAGVFKKHIKNYKLKSLQNEG